MWGVMLAAILAAAAAACIPRPADKWPNEPLAALLLREPFTIVANELGENRIIVLISNESEYGDDDNARFRLTLARSILFEAASRELPNRPLLPSKLKWKSALANELFTAPWISLNDGPRPFKYSALKPIRIGRRKRRKSKLLLYWK